MSITGAVIVASARTPIGKVYRGAFNNPHVPALEACPLKGRLSAPGLSPVKWKNV